MHQSIIKRRDCDDQFVSKSLSSGEHYSFTADEIRSSMQRYLLATTSSPPVETTLPSPAQTASSSSVSGRGRTHPSDNRQETLARPNVRCHPPFRLGNHDARNELTSVPPTPDVEDSSDEEGAVPSRAGTGSRIAIEADLPPAIADDLWFSPEERHSALAICHNSMVGHCGYQALLAKVRTRFPDYRFTLNECAKFVKDCGNCQINFGRHPRSDVRGHVIAEKTNERPMKQWQVDNLFIGGASRSNVSETSTFLQDLEPLTSSSSRGRTRKADKYGFSYVQVWRDPVSRAVELYPMKEITAEATVGNVLDIISRYGTPTVITSDRGSNFTSDLIEKTWAMLHTLHNKGVANRPQSQGIVERCNQEVLRDLRAMIIDVPEILNSWSRYLPLVRRRLWLTPNRFTQCSPIDFLGGVITLDIPFLDPSSALPPDTPPHPTLEEIANAAERIRLISLRRQRAFDLARLATLAPADSLIPVGSLVLVRPNPNAAVRLRTDKLVPVIRGPYILFRQNGSQCFLRDPTDGSELEPVHIERIFPFRQDGHIDPKTWEARRKDLFLVEEIREWRTVAGANAQRIRDTDHVEFLVKWTGYAEPTWNTSKPLLRLLTLKRFIEANPLLHTAFRNTLRLEEAQQNA